MDAAQLIIEGKGYLGIEFGSTRIKAVLVDKSGNVLASGGHSWENRYEDGVWTYSLNDIWDGLQDCYKDLKENVKKEYGVTLKHLDAIGFSAMMHGYLAFDENDTILVPFRRKQLQSLLQNLTITFRRDGALHIFIRQY